jgi:hypothetical protein
MARIVIKKSIPNNSLNIQTFLMNVPLGNESNLIWLEVILSSLTKACFGESLMFPIFDPHQYNVPHHQSYHMSNWENQKWNKQMTMFST